MGFVRIATLVVLARNDDAEKQILRYAQNDKRGSSEWQRAAVCHVERSETSV